MSRPPTLPRRLLRLTFDRDAVEVVTGDLDEAFAAWRDAGMPAARARARYWRLALASAAAGLRHRRPRAAAPAPREALLRTFVEDVRHGARVLARAPGFTATAVLTLALGIGANTAIFSLVHAQLFTPLGYHAPDRVAFLLGWDTERQRMRFNLPLADVLDLRERAGAFDAVAAYRYWSANLTGLGAPERVQAYHVTGNTFRLLGVPALHGRTFGPDEDGAGAARVAVVSHGFWQRHGASPGMVGGILRLDGDPYTVVGVMPPAFEFPVFNFKGDVWVPLAVDEAAVRADRTSAPGVVAIARIGDGEALGGAQADADRVMRVLAAEYPQTNRALGVRVLPMQELGAREARPALFALLGTVGFVLLLACANLANLLLARGVARRRELAVRAALGASRARIVRQLITESALLAAAGGAAGLLLAWWGLGALRASLPTFVASVTPNLHAIGLSPAVLQFTVLATALTGLLFGLVPAIRAARPALQDALRSQGPRGGAPHRRLRQGLVAAEVALSLMLLVAAGLMIRSLQNLLAIDAGFEAAGVVTATVALPAYKYEDDGARQRFFEDVVDRVRATAGIEHAAAVNVLPFSTYDRGASYETEAAPRDGTAPPPRAGYRAVTPGYFETMGIPLAAGRDFAGGDRDAGVPVAIVNRTLAARAFAGADPIGRRLRTGGPDAPWRTVVGVVADVRHNALAEAPDPEIYVPMAQAPQPMMMLVARAPIGARALPALEAAVRQVDADQPVFHADTMESLVNNSLLAPRMAMALMTLFGAVALLLAGLGVFGVISYVVRQETYEIGVRIALGATPAAVGRHVLGHAAGMVGAGLVAGVAGALLLGRAIGGLLYDVAPADPLAFGGAVALLAAVALAACLVPARRAARVDPLAALRAE